GSVSKSAQTLKAIDTALHNVSFGHNGQLDVTFDVIDNRLGLQIPVIHDTDAWDGVTQQFYLHGGTIDPLKNTPLADLVRSRADIDGYFNRNTGKYDVKISGDLQLFGSGSTGYVEFDNAGAHLNAHLYPLGADLLFQGDIYANGDYDLQA